MKYLIYLRVSTEKQDIEMQHKMIFNYLNSKYRENAFEYEVFSDPETSSRIPMEKRKGLQDMLKSLKKGYVVLVYKLDRLSRDILEMVSIYRTITREHSASVHSLNDPYCDDFSVGLMGVLAEKEREDTRKKTTDALKNKKQKGERYSRFLPYGFDMHETHMVPIRQGDQIVMKRGVLVPIAHEQRVIQEMIALSNRGLSYGQIAQELNDQGYNNREGKPFQKMSIYRILQRLQHTMSKDQHQKEIEVPSYD